MAMTTSFKTQLRKRFPNSLCLKAISITDNLLVAPIRLVRNHLKSDITISGVTYTARMMSITSAAQAEGTPGETTIVIKDVSQSVFLALEALPPCRDPLAKVFLYWVTAVDADAQADLEFDVIQKTEEYELRSYNVHNQDLTLQLTYDARLSEYIPKDTINPSTHPGGFGAA